MINQRIDRGGKIISRMDENGYARVEGVVAKVGVMTYMEGGKSVREYVPEDVLFNQDSMNSLVGCPLTLHHPPELVNGSNYKNYTQGSVTSVRRDGDNLIANHAIVGAEALNAVESGIDELSPGYAVEIDYTPGVWNGQQYDRKQTLRRYNHDALTDMARGGKECRLNFDCAIAVLPENSDVAKVKLPNGDSVDVGDASIAKTINDALTAQGKRFDSLQGKVKTTFKSTKSLRSDADDMELPAEPTDEQVESAVDKLAAMAASLSDQVQTLQAQVDEMKDSKPSDDTPVDNTDELPAEKKEEARTDAISQMLTIIENAKKLKPELVHLDSAGKVKTSRDIMVEALTAARKNFRADGKDDVYVTARFDAAIENLTEDSLRKQREFKQDSVSLGTSSQKTFNDKFYAGKA